MSGDAAEICRVAMKGAGLMSFLSDDWFPPLAMDGSLFAYDPLPGPGRGLFGGLTPAPTQTDDDDIQTPLTRLAVNEQAADATPSSVASQTASSDRGDELALNAFERMLVPEELKANALDVLGGLTGDEFTQGERNDILNQILRNVSRADAEEFQSIRPGSGPIQLTPKQLDIVLKQIEMLAPPIRDRARSAFQSARDNGKVVCPQCP